MSCPDYLEPRIAEMLDHDMELITSKRYWAVVLGLKPTQDGDMWCLLWGDNLQTGVAAFGKTPYEAILAFEKAMYAAATMQTRKKVENEKQTITE